MTLQLTDQELLRKAKFYGKNALKWRRKFSGLLPEIQRRRLYEKKGFSSIFEFSYKLAGLSQEQVRLVLCLEQRFIATPTLRNLLVTGEVSVNKLARVASIATPENEAELAQAVKILPKSAVETLVRDEKFSNELLRGEVYDGRFQKLSVLENKNGLFKANIEVKSVPGHSQFTSGLQLNAEVAHRLLELQEKGIDLNKLLTEFLDRREQEIAEEKNAIAENLQETHSRHVPARVLRVVTQEHGNKCSIRTCVKPSEQLHHTQTFSLSRLHDPHYLAPLCKDHHTLAHSVNLRVREKRTLAASSF